MLKDKLVHFINYLAILLCADIAKGEEDYNIHKQLFIGDVPLAVEWNKALYNSDV